MPIGDLLAQISGSAGPSPTMPTATLPPKRKANDELRKPVDKLQRTTVPSTSRPITQAQRPTAVDTSMSKMKIDTNTQRPTPNSANTTFKNGQPTPPPSTDSAKPPPKKGSFAEIIARAKAAQATLGGQVGKIQHKRIEKAPTKRELEKNKTQRSKNIKNGMSSDSKFQKSGQPPVRNGQNGAKSASAKPAAPVPEKKIKKAAVATTGYAGTARPKPGGSQSTAKAPASSYSARNGGTNRYRGKKDLDRYYATDEDEDDEEDDDGEDLEEDGYASDGSSDMEAGAWDVEDEEAKAERIAKQEDAEALAEENRLKREKAEKKARLAAMARSRR
ncbi:SPT2 chromatin protein [Rutstroemia sp. NJR-2017a BBW]|nr:SPT2 chromatin protein [Rutstroemia sp. NJR-2017a BBW]